MDIQETIQAGGQLRYGELSDFFRVLEAGSQLTAIFYREGREMAKAENIGAGYAEKFAIPFDAIVLKSAVNNPIHIVLRHGNTVTYDAPPNGAVNGSFSHTLAEVTMASAQIAPANTTRRYLMVQNGDAVGEIAVRLDGGDATAGGIVLAAGESLELTGFVPTGAVMASGDIASNPNVLIVEG